MIGEENEGFVSENEGFGWGRGRQDKVCACEVRENWKVFENCHGYNPIYAKHAIFVTGMSCEQVAKTSCQNPLTKFLKNLFKCFSQLESSLVSKSWRETWIILCKLATRAFTHEQVAKLSHEKTKNQEILKFF